MTGFFDQLQFWHWLILALLFAGIEMLSPGFFFIWLGGAALLLGLITLVISSMGWEVQLILFALFAAASVMAWYKFGRKLPVADIDGRNMRRAALQQNLCKAARRRADIERLATGRIETETVEPGDQLQGGAGDVAACRIVDGDRRVLRDRLARLGCNAPVDRDGAALDGVARPRAGGKIAPADKQFVKALAVAGVPGGGHRLSVF